MSALPHSRLKMNRRALLITSAALATSGAACAERREPLFDSHAHVFSPDIARYPVDTRDAREGEENLRQRIAENAITPDRLLGWWAENGVIGGASVQYNTVYRTDNRYLLDVSDAHPDQLSAVVILDAQNPETPAQLDRLVVERGVVGLRLFGFPDAAGAYPWLDSEAALDAWRMTERHALNMVIMYVPSSESPAALGRILALAEQFPNTRITLDHCGWPAGGPIAPTALAQFRDVANVYFKVTTINFRRFDESGVDAARWVRDAADTFGAGRLMWGSDVGNTPESYAEMAHRARASAALLDAGERRLFLSETARGLFERRRG